MIEITTEPTLKTRHDLRVVFMAHAGERGQEYHVAASDHADDVDCPRCRAALLAVATITTEAGR